jgi:hypothetical protein
MPCKDWKRFKKIKASARVIGASDTMMLACNHEVKFITVTSTSWSTIICPYFNAGGQQNKKNARSKTYVTWKKRLEWIKNELKTFIRGYSKLKCKSSFLVLYFKCTL